MGLLEFFAFIINSLAWPVTTLLLASIIVAVFKDPLVELIHRVRKISHRETAVELSERIQQLGRNERVREGERVSSQPIRINQRDRFTIRNDPRALAIEALVECGVYSEKNVVG